jgi:phosphocarrier protein
MALMQLGVKCGETVKVTIEGEDEATVAPIVEEFFKANF